MTNKYFTFDSGAITALGRDSIRDASTAVIELVKNSYDAGSSGVRVSIFLDCSKPRISIEDSGKGMSEEKFDSTWMRIGFSEKRKNTHSENRRQTGEKGIGRLAAHRLGNRMLVETKSQKKQGISVDIRWSLFEKEGLDAGKIPVTLRPLKDRYEPFLENSPNGTRITITELRDTWDKDDVASLAKELSMLSSSGNKLGDSFYIELINDISPELNGIIENPAEKQPLLSVHAKFDGVDSILYQFKKTKIGRSPKDTKFISERPEKISLQSLSKQSNKTKLLDIGIVEVEIKFYPSATNYVDGISISKSDLKQYLDIYAGVKIFRDNIWVKPYGDIDLPEGDWLHLDRRQASNPAGKGRSTFRVRQKQIVGSVFISRDINPELLDSSSREGLVDGDGLHKLRSVALACISLLEAEYHANSKALSDEQKPSVDMGKPAVEAAQREVKELFRSLISTAKSSQNYTEHEITELKRKRISLEKSLETASNAIDELASHAQTLRTLATIGISSTVFAHETESALEQVLLNVEESADIANDEEPDLDALRSELESAKEAGERVAIWGKFALGRVKKDKRTKKVANIKNEIIKTTDQMIPIFESVGISVDRKLTEIKSRVFLVDMEAILINLMTNSYAEILSSGRKQRSIKIELRRAKRDSAEYMKIIFSDSGRGVPDQLKSRIFDPLFSSKTDQKGRQIGTGLGLSIVKSIIDEAKGAIQVDSDPVLKGARFTIEIPVIK